MEPNDHLAPGPISRRSAAFALFAGVVLGVLGCVLATELVVRAYLPMVRFGSAPKARLTSLPPCPADALQWRGGKCSDPRSDAGSDFSDEEIRSDGEPTLRAWFIAGPAGSTEKTVIFVHGAGSDRREGNRFIQTIHSAGWALLLVDLRNHGTSDNDGTGITYGVMERNDVLRAAAWVRAHKGAKSVVTFGISMGAATAILAAAQDPAHLIDGVIAECPYADIADVLVGQSQVRHLPSVLGLAVMEELRPTMGRRTLAVTPAGAVAAISPRPLLVIVDGNDTLIPPWHHTLVFEEAREPRRKVEIPEAGHALGFNVEPAKYAAELVGFLAQVTHPE